MRRFWWVGLVLVVVLLGVIAVPVWHYSVRPMPKESAYVPPSPWPERIPLPAAAVRDWNYFDDQSGVVVTGWQVHRSDVQAVENHLDQIANTQIRWGDYSFHIEQPEAYNMQFLGIAHDGKKLIFVNAFCEELAPNDEWRTHLAVVSDGFRCFWHTTYDPVTGRFFRLTVNGRA
jgi:hypothetical protein